jgi:tRNA modification GTPase
LIGVAAWAEAAIDFAEEDVPTDALGHIGEQVAEILEEIRGHLNDARRGERLRDGVHLTVIGPPNSGKSSLINALAQRDVAIVSETAGTTRDVLEVHLNLDGYPVIVADTAGLRETENPIEREGVRRALVRAERADVVLALLDATAPDQPFASSEPSLRVWNKVDLAPAPVRELGISVRTGEGLDRLLKELQGLVRGPFEQHLSDVALTRPRHRHALTEAAAALARSLTATAPELLAEELRMAMRHLGRITGRVDVEDLLDVVFRDFCIGK